jgi:uncharacterized protein YacL
MENREEKHQVEKEDKPVLLSPTIGFLITSLLVSFFNDDLMQLLTPFMLPLLLIFLVLIFLAEGVRFPV